MYNISQRLLGYRLFQIVALSMTALFLCGCGSSGPKFWPVSGKVTFQGRPVTEASIRFSNPLAGVDLIAEIDTSGEYTITGEKMGLPEGTYRVAVIPKLNYDNVKSTPSGLVVPSSMPAMNRPDIPTRYHEPQTSGLTLTVKPEPNTFDVEMQ